MLSSKLQVNLFIYSDLQNYKFCMQQQQYRNQFVYLTTNLGK